MRVEDKTIKIDTYQRLELIDITGELGKFLLGINAQEGQLLIFVKHVTMAVIINENEKGFLKDVEILLERTVPQNADYQHLGDDNADAHLKSILLGISDTIPVLGGKLQLGTWQNIFAVELDGPRNDREIHLQFLGK